MTPRLILLSGFILCGLVVAFIIARHRVRRVRASQGIGPVVARAPELGSQDDAVRRLRLTAYQLRNIGMALHGAASDMASAGAPHMARIAAVADDAFELAEDLHEYTIRSNQQHSIHDEPLHLASALDEALGELDAAIRPGLREWLVAPDISAIHMRADRRALRFILRDSLSVAIRSTGNTDPVTITFDRTEGEFALQIEYSERAWVPMVSRPPTDEDGRRGALRLTLVRQLVEAHGGRVETIAVSANKAAIRLYFPADRVLDGLTRARVVAMS